MKQKLPEAVEKNLSFVNEVSAGIGLVIGYALFSLYWLTTPDTPVEVTTQSVVYEEKVIGYVPEPQDIESLSDVDSLERTMPVTAKMPLLDDEGKPVLETVVKKYRGKGSPQVIVDYKEIVVPRLQSNEVKVIATHDMAGKESFYLDTILHGTGFYYEDKRVTFDGVMSPDIFAIRMGTLFAFVSLILLLIRIRAFPRTVQFFKDLMQPDDDDGFLSNEELTQHYQHVEHFKNRVDEIESRALERYLNNNRKLCEKSFKNLTRFSEEGEKFLASGQDNDEYVFTLDGISFIQPPLMSDLVNTELNNHYRDSMNPLEINSFSLDQAEFICEYFKSQGPTTLRYMRLKTAVESMLQTINPLRQILLMHWQNQLKKQD